MTELIILVAANSSSFLSFVYLYEADDVNC